MQTVKPAYVPVRVGGHLVFRYDPIRHVVEWMGRDGNKHYIDLATFDSGAQDDKGE
jgi:hypothetical protein